MAIKNTIFNIIKSLSMNEKRYFKIYCKQHVLNGQNKYVLLFDLIDQQIVFDNSSIKVELKKHKFSTNNFSSDINYLTKILLKCLNEFHSEKTSDLRMKQNLITIEILFYKGLYEECLHLISKTKRIKLAEENKNLLSDLLNWEKKCVGYSRGLLGAIEVNNQLDIYFDDLKEKKIITDLYYKSYNYKNIIGKISIENLTLEFETAVIKPLNKKQFELKTLQSNVFYNLIFANYYKVKNEKENELIYLRKVISIYEENEEYKFENPLDFISIYIRIIDINKRKDSPVFYTDLEKLKGFNSIISLQNKVAEERIFLHSNQLELEHLLYINKTTEAFILLDFLKSALMQKKYNVEPYYLISTYYLFTAAYISIKNFSLALKYANTILNEYHFNQHPKAYIQAEFLNIVIHYELKNYVLVLKFINQLQKKYRPNFRFSYFELEILKTITKVSKNPHIVNEKVVFTKLKNEIFEKYEESQLIYNNYLKYIISKTLIQ